MISSSWTYVNDDDVAGWTSTTDWMEYWSVGMQGITPVDGRQFAELNAKAYSTIYQDVPTTPGETISWRFSHRGRTGVDVMRLLVGVPTAIAEPHPRDAVRSVHGAGLVGLQRRLCRAGRPDQHPVRVRRCLSGPMVGRPTGI